MPVICLSTYVEAPIETVFDLSRSIELHMESTSHTDERAVAGRTSGLISYGETVTWEATHFLLKLQLTSQIVEYDRPNHFRDSMVAGPFKRFDHDHDFETCGAETIMKDRFDYTSPLGPLGRIGDILFLKRYMANLLRIRNKVIQRVAKSPEYGRFVSM